MNVAEQRVDPDSFLAADGPILDVRSPSEHAAGHVPGAVSFPLFDDDERAAVGLCYKRDGRREAIDLGFRLVGPKLADMIATARGLDRGVPFRMYCWRGGMRSESLSWLLRSAELPVLVLEGGYKAYRAHVREHVERHGQLRVLGGLTGSAKTEVLLRMRARGAQVVDLEGLAGHLGSAFGNLARTPQPTHEQFSNDLHRDLMACEPGRPIWVEDESRAIGTVQMPEAFYARIRESPLFVIERDVEERVAWLVETYGSASRESLAAAFSRIQRRLGGARTQEAAEAVDAGDFATAARIALAYYDKSYAHGLSKRDGSNVTRLDVRGLDLDAIADRVLATEHEPA